MDTYSGESASEGSIAGGYNYNPETGEESISIKIGGSNDFEYDENSGNLFPDPEGNILPFE